MPSDRQQQWLTAATATLAAGQNSDGSWSYGPGRLASVEPTALAVLALRTIDPTLAAVANGCAWLSQQQEASGHFRPTAGLDQSTWVTPLAALTLGLCGFAEPAQRAAAAMLDEQVFSVSRALTASLYGYNTELKGWPWRDGGYSFAEPTASALLLLKHTGYGQHQRVREAVTMLRDRAIAGGGWNYGEPVVLDGQLFPTVLPSSLALLALADEQDAVTAAAVGWLAGQREQSFSVLSHGWAMIALKLYNRLNEEWDDTFLGYWQTLPSERTNAVELALGILALSPASDPLEVLA